MSTKENLKWSTVKRKVDDLIPFEINPRKMSPKQVGDLKKSIEKFDLVEIPVIDTDNTIVAGHQRLKIMQLIGRGDEVIEVRIPNRKLTQDEFNEYNIRSNKNIGDWDFNILSSFDSDLLIASGFTTEELNIGFGLDLNNFGEKNKEIEPGGIADTAVLTFKFSNKRYLEILEAFDRAKRDLVVDSNEEVLETLLEKYV